MLLLTLAAASLNVDIAIVGGGPCGLATALALKRSVALKDVSVAIFDRDPAPLQPKGAALQISGAGWLAIEAVDAVCAEEIRATGTPVTSVRICALNGDNETPRPVRLALSAAKRVFRLLARLGIRRGVTRTHLWHDVRTTLAERAAEVCGTDALRLGHTLEGVVEDVEVVSLTSATHVIEP